MGEPRIDKQNLDESPQQKGENNQKESDRTIEQRENFHKAHNHNVLAKTEAEGNLYQKK